MCHLLVARRVSLVKERIVELAVLAPLVTPGVPVSTPSGVRGAQSVAFCVAFCNSLFILLSIFFWPLCLSVLLGFMVAFGHPFDILKLFCIVEKV